MEIKGVMRAYGYISKLGKEIRYSLAEEVTLRSRTKGGEELVEKQVVSVLGRHVRGSIFKELNKIQKWPKHS